MRSLTNGHIKQGINLLRSAKLRNFGTMFGVIIGVSSVITVVSIGEGIKAQITTQVQHTAKNLLTVRPKSVNINSGDSSQASSLLSDAIVSSSLSSKDIATVSAIRGVAATAPLTVVGGSVEGKHGTYHDGVVLGTSSSLLSLLNQSIAYGSFLTDDEIGTNTAVLGQAAAQKLFSENVPLGQMFSFRGQQFVVGGILNASETTPLSDQANFNNDIFIPNDVAESLSNNTAPTFEIFVKPSDPNQATRLASTIAQALNTAHGGDSSIAVLTQNQSLDSSSIVLELLTRLIAATAAISLLVGGIGIMNVMLVSVSERMHEIGIRKAVGATNRQIVSQFMVEATVLSTTGGLIGIIVSIVLDIGLHLATNLRPLITWQIVLIATVVSLAVGIIFGSIPALKAARKDPIDALRSE
jgi:putative ABC transport system permease protein